MSQLLRRSLHQFRRRRLPWVWFGLRWPRELEAAQALAWLEHLAGLAGRGGLLLETRATDQRIEHQLAVSQSLAGAVQASAQTVPGLHLEPLVAPSRRADRVWSLRLTSRRRPLRTQKPETTAAALLATLSGLKPGEQVVLAWRLGPRLLPVVVPNQLRQSVWWPQALGLLSKPLSEPETVDVEARNALRAKQGSVGWRASLRLGVQARDRARQLSLLRQVTSALRTAEAPGVRWFARAVPSRSFASLRRPLRWPLAINAQELLGLLAWPLGDSEFPKLERLARRVLPPVDAVPPHGRVLASAEVGGKDLCLNPPDALQHLHALGPTGTGKSTLLLNLIVQDMEAGRGVVVIEPKGDLVRQVLERVPAHRLDDVVLLDPLDESPVGLNPLANPGASAELVADQLLAIFRGLWAEHWGPRTQDILHASLLTLARSANASLALLPLLLTNPAFRRPLVARNQDALGLGSFWSWYESISDAERATAISPVMNKLRAFLMRPALRAVIGQPAPRFDMSEVFSRRRILLVKLAKGVLGSESAGLLGSLVLGQLWQAAQARVSIAPERRHPVFIYVDEFQDYLHLPTDLADALAQARSLGVGFTLAHQHLGQLSSSMRAAVLANARSRVCFTLAADDAAGLARNHPELVAADFRGLRAYEVYASLVAGNQPTRFISGRTKPAPEPTCSAEAVTERSRGSWGVSRSDTEAALGAVIADATEPMLGKRRRSQGGVR